MVVVAVDAHQARAIDLRVENLGRLEIGRHKDVRLQAEARGLRRDRVRQVAGRGAADRGEAEGLRVGERDGNDAILEAQRRKADGIVLDVEIVPRRCACRGSCARTSGVKPTGRSGSKPSGMGSSAA